MKIKILNTQDEKKINKELEKIENEDRDVENIIPFRNKTWILHYRGNKEEIEKEIKSIREDLNKLDLREKQ